MQNRNWLMSEYQQRQRYDDLITWQLLKTKLRLDRLFWFATLLLLALLLTSCGHNPPQPCSAQTLPSPPALRESIPSVSYSIRAQESFKAYQGLLTPMFPTSQP